MGVCGYWSGIIECFNFYVNHPETVSLCWCLHAEGTACITCQSDHDLPSFSNLFCKLSLDFFGSPLPKLYFKNIGCKQERCGFDSNAWPFCVEVLPAPV